MQITEHPAKKEKQNTKYRNNREKENSFYLNRIRSSIQIQETSIHFGQKKKKKKMKNKQNKTNYVNMYGSGFLLH